EGGGLGEEGTTVHGEPPKKFQISNLKFQISNPKRAGVPYSGSSLGFEIWNLGFCPHATGLRSRPMPSISASTTSPFLRKIGGSRPAPTPAGVPVEMTSPGSSVVNVEIIATIAATGKIICPVLASCIVLPLTRSFIASACGSARLAAERTHGPIGR